MHQVGGALKRVLLTGHRAGQVYLKSVLGIEASGERACRDQNHIERVRLDIPRSIPDFDAVATIGILCHQAKLQRAISGARRGMALLVPSPGQITPNPLPRRSVRPSFLKRAPGCSRALVAAPGRPLQ